jgi:hypothetical protein
MAGISDTLLIRLVDAMFTRSCKHLFPEWASGTSSR